jgi:hypothetical protein
MKFIHPEKRRGRAGLRRNGKKYLLELALALRGELSKINHGGSVD